MSNWGPHCAFSFGVMSSQSSLEKQSSASDGSNPFRVPSNAELVKARESEKKKRQAKRELRSRKKIWERVGEEAKPSAVVQDAVRRRKGSKRICNSKSLEVAHRASDRKEQAMEAVQRESESISEMIKKKRDMFLMQMSLNIKHEEMRKLEAAALEKEAALTRAEKLLEEDAVKFDAFLKENDKLAHDSIQRHEKASMEKQEATNELKKLQHDVGRIRNDILRLRGSLEQCLKYRRFLNSCTPLEWLAERGIVPPPEHVHLIAKEQSDSTKSKDLVLGEEASDDGGSSVSSEDESGLKAARRMLKELKEVIERDTQTAMEENTESKKSRRKLPLYFDSPDALMEVFKQLEEKNLFLIQSCQEIEGTQAEMRARHDELFQRAERERVKKQMEVEQLRKTLHEHEQNLAQLRETSATTSAGISVEDQRFLLDILSKKVNETYRRCGFHAASDASAITKMTAIENKLEELISYRRKIPPDFVTAHEKRFELGRRNRVRRETAEAKALANEMRLQR
ncbi:MAG: hypothetical protein MHM6MM_000628 [Cercozoa sp. M6MM]